MITTKNIMIPLAVAMTPALSCGDDSPYNPSCNMEINQAVESAHQTLREQCGRENYSLIAVNQDVSGECGQLTEDITNCFHLQCGGYWWIDGTGFSCSEHINPGEFTLKREISR